MCPGLQAMHSARFAVWSGLLYGLVSLNVDLGICTPPKLLAAADLAVELLSKSPRQWVFSPGLGAKSISQLFWALAKLGYEGRQLEALVDALEKLVLERDSSTDSPLAGANAQDLSSLCWALARLLPAGARCARVWAKCLVGLERFMSDGFGVHVKPQDISNSVWAFATAVAQGMPPPAGSHLFLGAAAAAVAKGALFHGSQQEWSNLLWGFGKLRATTQATEGFLLAARTVTRKFLPLFSKQALANCMWGLASLGDTKAAGLALEAMDETRQSMAHLSAQDISNLCWAFGTLSPKERLDEAAYAKHVLPMLHAVADRVAEGGLKGALSQNWANICWCFATLAVYIPKAFYASTAGLAAGIAKNPLSWAPIDFSSMLWACAHMGHDPKDPHLRELWIKGARLYTDFPPDAWPPHLISHDGQDLGNLAMAWAVLFSGPGTRSPETDASARVIFDTAASLDATKLSEACLTALAQAHIEACDVGLPGGGVPAGPVREAMLGLWAERKQCVTCSEFQQRVAKVATAAGAVQVELEAPTADGLFRVDVSYMWPLLGSHKALLQTDTSQPSPGNEERGFVRVCIECDGPYHFLSWPNNRLFGGTILRDRQLARRFPIYIAASWHAWGKQVLPQRSALKETWQSQGQQHQEPPLHERQQTQREQQQGGLHGQVYMRQGRGEEGSLESQIQSLGLYAREGDAAAPSAGAKDGSDTISNSFDQCSLGMQTSGSGTSQGEASPQRGGASGCTATWRDGGISGGASGCKVALPDDGRGWFCPRASLVEQRGPAGAQPGTTSAAVKGDDPSISLRPGGSLGKRRGAGGGSLGTDAEGADGDDSSINLRPRGPLSKRWGAGGAGLGKGADGADGDDSSISLRPGGTLGKRWGTRGAPAPLVTSAGQTQSAAAPKTGAAVVAATPTEASTPSRDAAAASTPSVRWLTAVMEMAASSALAAPGACFRL
ncbi:hypothetical protein DUNSADRAFT_2854 [Dunaliella salina]|uniref:Uncharacterized protein n=1 Tax=Dunaliella salina TaxID=3046 RepID=A0ABQ7GV43_DUNSA|nr:hypothetical protein DUNSADRAFT_2854 [Dunaliella salina]|eukprot:KAF5838460.1 hypothetical protein DUNSADRAFT_2854 [Dunaliella salina]